MFWLANLQKMNFMLDIVTKWGKCHYKMGSFLFYKTGQVVLQSREGITEWHNFYYKWETGVFQSGAIITKKSRIVQKDSDISFLEPQSLTVKLVITESCMDVWYQTMDIVQSNRVFFKKTQSIKNTWKSIRIVIQLYALNS